MLISPSACSSCCRLDLIQFYDNDTPCLRLLDVHFAAHSDIGVVFQDEPPFFFLSAWINTTCQSPSPCLHCRAILWNSSPPPNFISFHFLSRTGWNENLPHQCDCIVKPNKWIRMYEMFTLKAGESVCRRQSAVCYNGNFSLVLFALELNNSGALLVCALITDKIRAGKLNRYQPLFVIATSKCL